MGPRQWALDVGIAVLLGGFAFADALTSTDFPQPGWPTALLMGAAGVALVLRRAWPELVSLAGKRGEHDVAFASLAAFPTVQKAIFRRGSSREVISAVVALMASRRRRAA